MNILEKCKITDLLKSFPQETLYSQKLIDIRYFFNEDQQYIWSRKLFSGDSSRMNCHQTSFLVAVFLIVTFQK